MGIDLVALLKFRVSLALESGAAPLARRPKILQPSSIANRKPEIIGTSAPLADIDIELRRGSEVLISGEATSNLHGAWSWTVPNMLDAETYKVFARQTVLGITGPWSQAFDMVQTIPAFLETISNTVPAAYFFDLTQRNYWFAGNVEPNEGSFLSEIGASFAADALNIGPNLTGPDLISNGSFDVDLSGWTAAVGSISLVSGAMRLTGVSGGASRAVTPVTMTAGRIFRSSVDIIGYGGSVGTIFDRLTTNSSGASGSDVPAGHAVVTTAAIRTAVNYWLPSQSQNYLALAASVTPHTVDWDNVSIREAAVFEGASVTALSAVVKGRAAAAHDVEQLFWRADVEDAASNISVFRDVNGDVRVTVTRLTLSIADFNLGPVDDGAPFQVAFGAAVNNFAASLNGQSVLTDTAGAMPILVRHQGFLPPDLVADGNFETGIAGWTAGAGSIAWENNCLRVNGAGGVGRGVYAVETEPGEAYRLKADLISNTGGTTIKLRVTTSSNGSSTGLIAEVGFEEGFLEFIAPEDQVYIALVHSVSPSAVVWNNVSLRSVEGAEKVAVFSERLSNADLQVLSVMTSPNMVVWGDSMAAATGATSEATRWYNILNNRLPVRRRISPRGIGGQNPSTIADRMLADTGHRDALVTIDSGRNGVLILDPADIIQDIQSMVDHLVTDRFIIFSVLPTVDGTEDEGSAGRASIETLNGMIQSTWPNNFVDIVPLLEEPATRSDGLHLSDAGQVIKASAAHDFILEKGW